MTIRFDDQVAIVTGSGNGLGKNHALELAKLGAKVVVNDFGGMRDGTGGSTEAADAVVEEIKSLGAEAIASGANVVDRASVDQMVAEVMDKWGRIDILINNAGILRDRSFGKMTNEEWHSVIDVHLNGTANCSLAVWNIMKSQNSGRILMTTSTSGVYGNFGQANYGAAKMGCVGLMNTLCIEGAKNNISVNCLAPTAATRMTEDIMTEDTLNAVKPEYVTPAALYLVSEQGPNRTIMFAGAGSYSVLKLLESEGVYLPVENRTVDDVAAQFGAISDMSKTEEFLAGGDHVTKILDNHRKANS